MRASVSECKCLQRPETPDPKDLELQVLVHFQMWVLETGTKLWSLTRAYILSHNHLSATIPYLLELFPSSVFTWSDQTQPIKNWDF